MENGRARRELVERMEARIVERRLGGCRYAAMIMSPAYEGTEMVEVFEQDEQDPRS